MSVQLLKGDCLDQMRSLDADSIDACVTDPPYGLSFMGKGWDHGVPGVEYWRAVHRALKPGAHIVAFGGTRTYHRLACAIEDAGFEPRDMLAWLYGCGFPKGKSALKPALEPIAFMRKPLSEKTLAANVLRWGTGALNIDGCRVGGESTRRNNRGGTGDPTQWRTGNGGDFTSGSDAGRWPANVVHDGSDEVVGAFPTTSSGKGGGRKERGTPTSEEYWGEGGGGFTGGRSIVAHGDSGSAARFFYSAKASKADRAGSKHPTVKPIGLKQWLVRLVTPPGGIVLDPFAGSGTTGEAAFREGFSVILIEREPEYQSDIERRLDQCRQPVLAI